MIPATPYRKALLQLAIPAVTLLLVVAGFLVVIYIEGHHREQERRRARLVFCEELEKVKEVQRVDKVSQIQESERFLRDNPDGLPGIPGDLIRRGIERDRAVLRDLAPVNCEDFARIRNLDID